MGQTPVKKPAEAGLCGLSNLTEVFFVFPVVELVFRPCPAGQRFALLKHLNIAQAKGHPAIAAHVVGVGVHGHPAVIAGDEGVAVNHLITVLIYNARPVLALDVHEVVALIRLVIRALLVTITHGAAEVGGGFTSKLVFFGLFDGGFDLADGFLVRLRDQNRHAVLVFAAHVVHARAEHVNVGAAYFACYHFLAHLVYLGFSVSRFAGSTYAKSSAADCGPCISGRLSEAGTKAGLPSGFTVSSLIRSEPLPRTFSACPMPRSLRSKRSSCSASRSAASGAQRLTLRPATTLWPFILPPFTACCKAYSLTSFTHWAISSSFGSSSPISSRSSLSGTGTGSPNSSTAMLRLRSARARQTALARQNRHCLSPGTKGGLSDRASSAALRASSANASSSSKVCSASSMWSSRGCTMTLSTFGASGRSYQ